MTEILRQPLKTQAAVSSRLKVMAKLDIAEKRLPQDGRIKLKMAGKDVDIRLSTVPIQNGERIVMRVLEKTGKIIFSVKLYFHFFVEAFSTFFLRKSSKTLFSHFSWEIAILANIYFPTFSCSECITASPRQHRRA